MRHGVLSRVPEQVSSSGGHDLSGRARPAAAEQIACAQAVARLVISHDHSAACAERLSGSTLGAPAAHLVGFSRRPRHRRKALDERFALVATARAVRAIGAVHQA
eukprot:2145727-Prymnesium_polylepis.1